MSTIIIMQSRCHAMFKYSSAMVRCFLIVTALLYQLSAHASPVNVIEVANFYCPECYAAEQHIKPLRTDVVAKGGQFDFVPIFFGKVSPWPAKVYLSLPKSQASTARDALFQAAILNGLPMASAQSACTVVTLALKKSMSISACVEGAMGEQVGRRLKAVLTLLKHVYPSGHASLLFPLFIVMEDGQIRDVLSRHQYPEVAALIKEVQRAVD